MEPHTLYLIKYRRPVFSSFYTADLFSRDFRRDMFSSDFLACDHDKNQILHFYIKIYKSGYLHIFFNFLSIIVVSCFSPNKMGDIFTSSETQNLLQHKHVVILGDSNFRSIYKDIISLLQSTNFMMTKDAKGKR